MVEVETRRLLWRKRNTWFAEPFEVDHGDAVFFYACPAPTMPLGDGCTPGLTCRALKALKALKALRRWR